MALTETQKKWAIGGSIGVLALFLGHRLFRPLLAFGAPARQLPSREQHKRKKHPHTRDDHGADHSENDRGEYGKKKHHRGHKHD